MEILNKFAISGATEYDSKVYTIIYLNIFILFFIKLTKGILKYIANRGIKNQYTPIYLVFKIFIITLTILLSKSIPWREHVLAR